MGHRNMHYSAPMIEMEMDQQAQGHFQPEPCVLYGNMPSFQPLNVHMVVPAPGNGANFDSRHLPEHHGTAPYGMTQYNGAQHQYPASNMDLVLSTASSQYNMYMAPSGPSVFHVPLNHGPPNQFPLPSNQGIAEVSAGSYGLNNNNQFIDGTEVSFKRKNAEGLPRNFPYGYTSVGPSSSAAPMIARPIETDVTPMDVLPFSVPDGRGNDISPVMDVVTHRSVRNRSSAIGLNSLLPHNPTHLIQGHYPGQPFQTGGAPWMDQQFNSSGGDIGGTLPWNQQHGLPYLQGSFNGASMEAANMGLQGYQVTARNRNSATFLPPPPIPQGHFNFNHPPPPPPPPPLQGAPQGHNSDLHSRVATSSRRSMNPFQDCGETGSRFVEAFPAAGLRMYRPHRRELTLDVSARQRNFPQMRVLPEDGVSLLELAEYHEIGDFIDHHRDMRLDIDDMSYEELLELGEQIGSVGSGLSDDFILGHLKSRSYVPVTSANMKDTSSIDQELVFCVICQEEYKDQEMMGVLDCGHEYHIGCIKKWLLVKNSCPVCKSAALTAVSKEL